VYGFLDYKKLLDVMDRSIFSASIAFIPWNYDRSGPRVADLFLKRSERLSLSVHGCDHIHAEFGTRDEQALRWRAWKALDRMKEQETLTGLPFDKVMIFPQGIFSISAMGALSSSGFLAAVNTTPYPVDGSDGVLTLRDLLDVAVERFSNFPLFVRHYPNDIAEFAFDLFLGKPALLVEHHRYFKNGYTILADFVGKLKALEEKLGWTNLAAICSQTCLKRVAENGETQLKFYTDRFRLQNDTDQTQNYRLFRRVMSEKPLARVIVNGRYADCDQAADYLRIPVSLDPGQKAEVSIDRGHLDTGKIYFKQRPMYNTMVFIRRGLSEFRDNYVDTHRRLSGIASRARNLLSKTKRNVLRKRSN